MRITSLQATQKTTTGDYEHLVLVVSATIDEDDAPAEAATKLSNFTDWFARKPVRDAQCRSYRKTLASEESTPEQKAKAEKWVAAYEARQAEIEAM